MEKGAIAFLCTHKLGGGQGKANEKSLRVEGVYTVKTRLRLGGLFLRNDFAGGGLFNLQVLGYAKHNVLFCFLHSHIAFSSRFSTYRAYPLC